MESNAPGQILGYSLQFPRALYHLLRCSPEDSVCVEVIGDVATVTSEGQVLSEEDKSSISGNPLSDRSVDLWKTFSNWIKAIQGKELGVNSTKFVLYANQSGRKSIAHNFSSAVSTTEAQDAITYAKQKLANVKPDHDIWDYYDFVVNQNYKLLTQMLPNFELQIGSGTGFEEVRLELQRWHYSDPQIDFLVESLAGWLQRIIMERISARKPAMISWDEFHVHFTVLLERLRTRELIDFTMHYSKEDVKVQKQVTLRPLYLKQLEAIELSEDEIMEAISDYLRADVNHEKWIENEIIDESVASNFEERLIKFWKNQQKRIEITEKSIGEIEQGQLLLSDCSSRMELIRDMTPPPSTVPGTYHALADESQVWWHPKWE